MSDEEDALFDVIVRRADWSEGSLSDDEEEEVAEALLNMPFVEEVVWMDAAAMAAMAEGRGGAQGGGGGGGAERRARRRSSEQTMSRTTRVSW